jgi:hypothetical protein
MESGRWSRLRSRPLSSKLHLSLAGVARFSCSGTLVNQLQRCFPSCHLYLSPEQRIFLDKALAVINRPTPSIPSGPGAVAPDEPTWKNTWSWNLTDSSFGHLVLDIKDGRVSSELKSQGPLPLLLSSLQLHRPDVRSFSLYPC